VWGCYKLINDITTAEETIRKMTTYAHEHDGIGMLNTHWGAYGHIHPVAGVFHGLIYGASLSWNVEDIDDKWFDDAVSILEFKDPTGRTVALLREFHGLHLEWYCMLHGIKHLTPEQIDRYRLTDEKLAKTCRKANEIAVEFDKLRESAPPEKQQAYNEFVWSSRAVVLNAHTAMWAKRYLAGEITSEHKDALREFAGNIRRLSDDYEAIWRARNKESELYMITDAIAVIARDADDIAAAL
jgi:hypothetical protein